MTVLFALIALLLAATGVALGTGHTGWATGLGGVAIGALAVAAWMLHTCLPAVGVGLAAGALAVAGGLWAADAAVGRGSLGIGVALLAAGAVLLELGTRQVNRERPTPLEDLGGTGQAGRALIVYHSTRGIFQPLIQRALAAGLRAQGWQVHLTSASRQAPADLSPYRLLVLGAPTYSCTPARAVLAYVRRLGTLRGLAVALVVSGDGRTERALRLLREQVSRAQGRVVEEVEVWLIRPNAERHGLDNPADILQRVGQRLQVPA
ncbi:MAG TPA: hypothetical protein VL359_19775 [bacterium]|nr:hypothetical protein [bacterium]